MANPGIRILVTSATSNDPTGAFALFTKITKVPYICASNERDTLIRTALTLAHNKLGLALIVDDQGQIESKQLLEACTALELEMATTPNQVPICEWEVSRINLSLEMLNPIELERSCRGEWDNETLEIEEVQRRLVLTQSVLLERYLKTYEVSERFVLGNISAIIRFIDEPQKFGIEWIDGSPPTLYNSTSRDAILSAILDLAQLNANRPIPILPDLSTPGESIMVSKGSVGYSLPVKNIPDIENIYVKVISDIGKAVHSILYDKFMMDDKSFMSQSANQKFSTSSQIDTELALSSDEEEGGKPLASSMISTAKKQGTKLNKNAWKMASNIGNTSSRLLGSTQTSFTTTGISSNMMMERESSKDKLYHRIREFNACVPYSGINPSTSLPEMAVFSICGLLPLPTHENAPPPVSAEAKEMISILQCLQRISASPLISPILLNAPDGIARIFAALLCGNDHVAIEAARLLVRLFAPSPSRKGAAPWQLSYTNTNFSNSTTTMNTVNYGSESMMVTPVSGSRENDFIISTAEDNQNARTAKSICLFPVTRRCPQLIQPMKKESSRPSPLLSLALVEVIGALICEPGSRTTDLPIFQKMLELCSGLGRPLFSLFSHASGRVSDGAAVIMRSVAECGAVAAAPMRDAALREGALLHHLFIALFGKGFRSKLSKDLVALWADEFTPALDLLSRIFPPGLIKFLSVPLRTATSAGMNSLGQRSSSNPEESNAMRTITRNSSDKHNLDNINRRTIIEVVS